MGVCIVNLKTLQEYRKFRLAGYQPPEAVRAARTVLEFRTLWLDGLVEIAQEHEVENYFDVFGEPDGYVNANGKRVSAEQERKEIEDSIERLGCMTTYANVRDDADSEWETIDSCGMHVGYEDATSPYENAYVIDHMAACVRYHAERASESRIMAL